MGKQNIWHYSLRLNVYDEQHQRINKTLRQLNKSIHKSTNQFIAEALDFYIKYSGDENLIEEVGQKKESIYVTKDDLEVEHRNIMVLIKDEIIKAFGTALMGGYASPIQITAPKDNKESINDNVDDNSTLTDLVGKWG